MTMKYNGATTILLPFFLLLPGGFALADEGGVYSAYDSNADGYLDREEFKVFLNKRRVREPYQHLWVFEKVDKNSDQRISNQELVHTLQEEMKLRSRKRQ